MHYVPWASKCGSTRVSFAEAMSGMRLIRRQIKSCYLFVPIISANTQSREEGYFRREWNLAVARTLDMAEDRAFLLPIVIDGTSDSQAKVPEKFREVHWMRLPAGANSDAFVEHVRRLLSPHATSTRGNQRPLVGAARVTDGHRIDRSLAPASRAFVPWIAERFTGPRGSAISPLKSYVLPKRSVAGR